MSGPLLRDNPSNPAWLTAAGLAVSVAWTGSGATASGLGPRCRDGPAADRGLASRGIRGPLDVRFVASSIRPWARGPFSRLPRWDAVTPDGEAAVPLETDPSRALTAPPEVAAMASRNVTTATRKGRRRCILDLLKAV